MKKIIGLILLFCLALSFCACGDDSTGNNSTDIAIVSNNDESSELPVDEKVPKSAISVKTSRGSYNFDEKINFTIEVDSNAEFTYELDFYVEFHDGKNGWKRCNKDFCYDDVLYHTRERAELSFIFSERADEGKEKYRIAMNLYFGGGSSSYYYTVYSNEFTAK